MKVTNGKDFWAGLMFFGTGLGFVLASQNYPMGSAVRMGPAYFPTMLGGLLAVLGAIIFFRAFFSKIENSIKVFPFRLPVLIASIVIGGATYLADSLFKNAPMAEFVATGLALGLFIASFGPRAMFVILIAVVIYGYALKPLGLVISTVILIVMSALGGHDFRKKEVVILTVVMVLFSVFVFVKGLGLPFNLWPGE